MPELLSLESLPHICSEALKCIHTELARAGHVACVAAGPVTSTPAPRPVPAPGDPYHELHAVLSRIVGVRLATQRAPKATVVCVLDGWVPTLPPPHPVLQRLALDIQRATLQDAAITSHAILYMRGCPHESFERLLDANMDADGPGGPTALGDVLGVRDRLDAVARAEALAGPFRVSTRRVIHAPPFCDDNPVAAARVGRHALGVIAEMLSATRPKS